MHCWECPYTERIQRKFGITTHCNLEPTHIDVSYHVQKQSNNTLCPFVCEGTKIPGVDYNKYIDANVEKWMKEK
jgi:hypothetical protein